MSAEEIAGAFMQHYYGTLDSNIAGLGPLYVSPSVRLCGGVGWDSRSAWMIWVGVVHVAAAGHLWMGGSLLT